MKTITIDTLREQQRQRRYARRKSWCLSPNIQSIIVLFLMLAIFLSLSSNYVVTSGLHRRRVLASSQQIYEAAVDNNNNDNNRRRLPHPVRKQQPKNYRIQKGKDGNLRIMKEQANDISNNNSYEEENFSGEGDDESAVIVESKEDDEKGYGMNSMYSFLGLSSPTNTIYNQKDEDDGKYEQHIPMDRFRTYLQEAPIPLDDSIVKHVDNYGSENDDGNNNNYFDPPLYYAQWKHKSEADKQFNPRNDEFFQIAESLICPSSVVIDIGAHGGDTPLMFAGATGPDGLVVAFEPGPPFQLLNINTWINSFNYDIHSYNFAIDATDGEWCYKSDCNGCNGNKVTNCNQRGVTKFVSHRLDDVLTKNYAESIFDQISFIKIDAEGHDSEILESFAATTTNTNNKLLKSKPVIQIEWFVDFQKNWFQSQQRRASSSAFDTRSSKIASSTNPKQQQQQQYCHEGTKKIFDAAEQIGYDVYSATTSVVDNTTTNITKIDHEGEEGTTTTTTTTTSPTVVVFEKKEKCEDLKSNSAKDLYLFHKDTPPMLQQQQGTSTGKGRKSRSCSHLQSGRVSVTTM